MSRAEVSRAEARRAAADLVWPLERLGHALMAIAEGFGTTSPLPTIAAPGPLLRDDPAALARWIEAAAAVLGIEPTPTRVAYDELESMLKEPGVALFQVDLSDAGGAPGYLVTVGARRGSIELLAPDGRRVRRSLAEVAALIAGPLEQPLRPELERLVESAQLPSRRRARAVQGLLRHHLGSRPIDGCWLLAPPPSAPWRQLLGMARVPRLLLILIGAHASQYAAMLVAWFMVGRAAFGGQLDPGWLMAWALVLLTIVPLRLLTSWSMGMLAIACGGLLRQRLLHGALKLRPSEVRHRGAGQLLGQAYEASTLETLGLDGGFRGLIAIIELGFAGWVLTRGAGGVLHLGALAAWLAVAGYAFLRILRQRREWVAARLAMTHDLVERMVGHRTLKVQQIRGLWHEGEDQSLEHYLEVSRQVDTTASRMVAGLPRGWMVLGLAGLAPAFIAGDDTTASLAIGLGGVILAQQALTRLAAAITMLIGAVNAWENLGQLLEAAKRPAVHGAPEFAALSRVAASGPLVELRDVSFRYRQQGEPVLRGVHLRIETGDRLLLEGSSGGGKSTLGSLLVGLRQPDSGLILLDGLDRPTLGDAGWHRHAASAPQFHENHVFGGTLGFNLLMGRRWPPRTADLEAATEVCRELGLDRVMARMPSGFMTQVGETGWQLSHGERSRVYIARALLQGAALLVLDESFAALDPQTLAQCLDCVRRRAPTLLVVAHP